MSDDPEVIDSWIRERVLGCGGFGVVTLWKNSETDERIAIKKHRSGLDTNLTQKHKDRWTQEVEMMQRIQNENIVSFVQLPANLEAELSKYNPSGLPMLSMEYCTQGDLRGVLSKSENCCGLPESDVRYILSDLKNAISYLHGLKITHRDLKPENIVLQNHERPNGIIYKLIDLGYAKELDAKSICASFVGTLQYLAPELLYSKTYSCSVDYWSLGLVGFEVICGTRPFLPNMSLAQWMLHVPKKTGKTICIYQQNESLDSIMFSEKIYSECHVSSCFKTEIEKWLQIALEYEPKKRGHINYVPNSSNNKLMIFKSLDALLKKKFISVFFVFTCEFCSYEIDECTLVSTLQGWIERDFNVLKSEQVLVSPVCDIDIGGLAVQFFDETYRQVMLYVFKKPELLMLDIKLRNIPELVQDMLKDSSTKLQYYFQKRYYAHSVFLVFNECNLYNTLLDACYLRIKKQLTICEKTNSVCKDMSTNVEQLQAKVDFSQMSLNFDLTQYLKNYSQKATHWSESFNKVADQVKKLHAGCKQIAVRYESICRRVSLLLSVFNENYSKYNNHHLNELLDETLSCYGRVRNRSKENRSILESCRNMAKIVYSLLKSRDKLIRDSEFRKYIQLITAIDNELETVVKSLGSAVELIAKYKKDLENDHIARQTKIWDFTIKQKFKPKIAEETQLKADFILGNPSISQNDYGTPITLTAPVHFILGDPNKQNTESNISNDSHQNSNENYTEPEIKISDVKNDNNSNVAQFLIGAPTSDLIAWNENLRYELQEITNESFLKYTSILTEKLDFDFLNE